MTDMNHMNYLETVALDDVRVLREKEATYKGSWKAAGGRSAWFMFRRNMDRLMNMLAPPRDEFGLSLLDLDDALDGKVNDEVTMAQCVVKYLRDSFVSEDIFRQIEAAPGGEDGTALACLRDLRRYAVLIEAEMIARGVVAPERGPLVVASLARRDEIESEFYHLKAQEWAVEPEQAKKLIEKTLRFGDSVAREICADWEYLAPAFNAWHGNVGDAVAKLAEVKSKRIVPRYDGPGTPEDGGHHASAWPWVVRRADLGVDSRVSSVWRFWSEGACPLEPSITEPERYGLMMVASDATHPAKRMAETALGLYAKSAQNEYVLRIDLAPPEHRAMWPTLRNEYNSMEHGALPAWQRNLYEWIEGETKWRVRPECKAWAES